MVWTARRSRIDSTFGSTGGLGYHRAVLRFIAYAVPLLILLLALFGFTVELLDVEPRKGSVIRLALFEQPLVPGQLVLGTWLVEASGLIALFLLAQGRFGAWWLDGLVAGWVAWVFRGPLLVITIVVAARQPQDPWWQLAFGWWVLYSVCGLSLAILARRSRLESWVLTAEKTADASEDPENPPATPQEPETAPIEVAAEPVEAVVDSDGEPTDSSPAEGAPSAQPPEAPEPDAVAPELESTQQQEAGAQATTTPEGQPPIATETEAPETPEEPVANMFRSPASGGTATAGGDTGKE